MQAITEQTMNNNSDSNTATASSSRPYTFDRVVRMLITIVVLAAIVWLVDLLSSVLLPFLVAWLIAYLLEPFVQYNRRLLRVRNRWLPIFMTLFETILLLSVLAIFVVPSVLDEMHQVSGLISRYLENGSSVSLIPVSVQEYIRENIDFAEISRQLTSQDVRSILDTLGSLISGSYDIVLGIFNWFIVLLYVVFIMLDYERLLRGFRHMVPPKYRAVTFKITNDVKDSMNHYFRGQALVAFIVGILFSIGFLIIGLPLAVVLGLFIGLLNLIPYLQLISLIPATLLCLVYSVSGHIDFWTIWCETMAVYIIVQCIQDLFLTPKIMGRAMGLNPAIILLSLSIWGTLMGFIGLIVALPLTTLLLSYYDHYIDRHEDDETPHERQIEKEDIEKIIESPDK